MAVDREKVLQAAQKLVEKRRFDKAIVEYQKLVADDPKDARTLLKIGDLYSKLEQYPEAVSAYERVAQFYSAQGFAVKAIAVYKQIREHIQKHVPHLEDRYGHILPRLAEIYTQLGLVSDALASYDEMASRLQRAGRDRDALDVFKKLVELDPQNPLPYLRLADAFLRVKDFDNAVIRYGTAAEILLKLGRRDDSLKVLEQLLKHRPEPRWARLAAELYLDRGQPNDGMVALTKLQICFKDNPKDLDTLSLLARAFDQLGQPAKAIEVQKESARIAKEAGRLDVYNTVVDALLIRAPQDDAVRMLAAQRSMPSAPSMAPPTSRASVEVDLDQVEEVEEADEADLVEEPQSEAPFALSQASVGSTAGRAPGGSSYRPPPGGSEDSVLAAGGDPQARIRQALARAELHRRARQYRPAVAAIEEALAELPNARDLHERLCDLLIEGGDQAGAVERMLVFARVLADEADYDGAARVLDEVLLLEPDQPDALQMLHDLGYAVSGEGYEQAQDLAVDSGQPYQSVAAGYDGRGAEDEAAISSSHVHAMHRDQRGGQLAQEPQGHAGYDPEAPLPAYDLDESAPIPGAAPGGFGDIDEPFEQGDAPLPSFALEDDEATRYAPPPPISYEGAPEPAYRSPPPPAPPPPHLAEAPVSAPAPVSFRSRQDADARAERAAYDARAEPLEYNARAEILDEDALEEVEFFAAQEMFDEARALLDEQLTRLPGHPLLLERRRELEILAAGGQPRGQESGAHQMVHGGEPRTASTRMPAATGARPASMRGADLRQETDDGDRAFDIAASLDALDALDALEAADIDGGGDPGPGEQVSVEAVFEQFKAGVAAHVSESDAATHYDLGAAYRDMGLHNDAIDEFRLAARDPSRECVCWSMIGMLQLEQGKIDEAIDAFVRGLHASERTAEQENKLNYEIGNAYEMRSSPDHALYYFQRVLRADPTYDDPRGGIDERVARVTPRQPPAATSRAVGAEPLVSDEFDAAFDELLSRGGKLP